jgi:hypothetical protein
MLRLAARLLLASCWEGSDGSACAGGQAPPRPWPCRVRSVLLVAADGAVISRVAGSCSGAVVVVPRECEVAIRKLPWLDSMVVPMEVCF